MDIYALIAAVGTIIMVVVVVFLEIINVKNRSPTYNIEMRNLPPYEGHNETSTLKVTNVGDKGSKEFKVYVEMSWERNIKLMCPTLKYFYLKKNESKNWNFRLCPPSGENWCKVHVFDGRLHWDKEFSFTV